ncbi:hypothetical protein [Nocardia mikamii]|uniref:hypothetical protein n=1 Tax=Nocardia mikamii TaxID=508464 RepID=UPI00142FF9DF|nr:hypothetical protein [Nocardia mikamii]
MHGWLEYADRQTFSKFAHEHNADLEGALPEVFLPTGGFEMEVSRRVFEMRECAAECSVCAKTLLGDHVRKYWRMRRATDGHDHDLKTLRHTIFRQFSEQRSFHPEQCLFFARPGVR